MSRIDLRLGDCREVMRAIPDGSIDAIVTDPPYELGFMGKAWDRTGIAYDPAVWEQALRVLKPGGHLLSFGGSRTYHRMACEIEDAGFEIRDQIMWLYGTGFPKSHDVSKAIDKAAGAEREVVGDKIYADGHIQRKSARRNQSGRYRLTLRDGIDPNPVDTAPATPAAHQWQGWGTALKPAHEPIAVARKPLIGTVAANVLEHGTGGINVDGCRISTEDKRPVGHGVSSKSDGWDRPWKHDAKAIARRKERSIVTAEKFTSLGRWPANVDGSEEVMAAFAVAGNRPTSHGPLKRSASIGYGGSQSGPDGLGYGDNGTAARFFYCAKASQSERAGSEHPTIKPLALMRYLCRLVTPPGGTVLDPFAGSGSTLIASRMEGFHAIGIERDPAYHAIVKRRCRALKSAAAYPSLKPVGTVL